MKTKLLIILVLILLFVFALYHFKKDFRYFKYKIDGKTYRLLVARTPKEWGKGLMYYKKPVRFDGMIFIFNKPKVRFFWNKNTYLDLDLYWLRGDKVVGRSYLPSITKSGEVTIESPSPVDKVVEIIK